MSSLNWKHLVFTSIILSITYWKDNNLYAQLTQWLSNRFDSHMEQHFVPTTQEIIVMWSNVCWKINTLSNKYSLVVILTTGFSLIIINYLQTFNSISCLRLISKRNTCSYNKLTLKAPYASVSISKKTIPSITSKPFHYKVCKCWWTSLNLFVFVWKYLEQAKLVPRNKATLLTSRRVCQTVVLLPTVCSLATSYDSVCDTNRTLEMY